MRIPFLFAAVLIVGCGGGDATPEAPAAGPTKWAEGEGTVVHLFEWKWTDIARECVDVLGPAGYTAVQVSPPSENHVIDGRPWWERYQPVSYGLETRSGSRADFAGMVAQCKMAGVDIYVDAVINHMTDADLEHPEVAFSARGTAGTEFTSYNYPGLYDFDDFHHCGLTDTDDIWDSSDQAQVELCELLDLADLDTSSPTVRRTIAAYLKDLASLGVAGLRVDAAMHIGAEDMMAILEEADWEGYVYQEVSQPQAASRFLGSGAVTDFGFGYELSEGVRSGSLSDMIEGEFWSDSGLASGSAFVFVDNHDTQRHGRGILTYKDAQYPLAVALMLATPYGRPRVMSSYSFDDTSVGPPSNSIEEILAVNGDTGLGCGEAWVCEHRWPLIAGMVGFEAAVRGEEVRRLQKAGQDRVAFTRGDRGWIGFNRSEEPWEVVHQTGLPGVSYCDVAQGTPVDGACAGGQVRVDAGMVSAVVPPGGVVAIHVEAQTPR